MSDTSNSAEPNGNEPNATEPADDPFPTFGRLLGIDYGTKRIGIAVSTPEQNIASPLENYTRINIREDAMRLADVASEYLVVGIVIGLPVHMSGDEGQKAAEVRQFGNWLHEDIGLPVCYWDERFTSLMAEAHLMAADLSKKKRKARMDMLAAGFMLQSFLDAEDRNQRPPSLHK